MLLKEKYPQLYTQFITGLNKGIDFGELTVGSMKKVWWQCEKAKDHKWQVSVNQRTHAGKLHGCPFCAGKKVAYSNSLKALYPKIVIEWDYEKNAPLTPQQITAGSNKKVWWQCKIESEHTWLASPKSRTSKNNTCPICKTLGYRFPEIARQWHPVKNGTISPFDISFSTHTKYWWKCSKGSDHIWKASPNTRTSLNSGCPVCSGYKVVKSNSLAVTHPEIAAQWYYKKNYPLTPDKVYGGGHKKIWWKCPKGDDHEWHTKIKSRVNGGGCPICSGRKIAKSNNMLIKYPKIAKLWHTTKNGNLAPSKVTPFSNQIVWWKCSKGDDHEWSSTVANVVSGSTCPVCMKRKITSTNNLFALFPALKEEWDFKKNKHIRPTKLSAGSHTKVWWICKHNNEHNWFATVKDRTQKDSGCPFCAIKLNVSELKMLEIIKKIFSLEKILYRYKPKWLKRMELDVYLPNLKLAFEYQGKQHFQPIDFFGGEQVYIEQVKRDKMKKEICDKRDIVLVYVLYDENLSKKLIQQKVVDAGFCI